jgi:hypothetical protein
MPLKLMPAKVTTVGVATRTAVVAAAAKPAQSRRARVIDTAPSVDPVQGDASEGHKCGCGDQDRGGGGQQPGTQEADSPVIISSLSRPGSARGRRGPPVSPWRPRLPQQRNRPAPRRRSRPVISAPQSTGNATRPAWTAGVAIAAAAATAANSPTHRGRIRPVISGSSPSGHLPPQLHRCGDRSGMDRMRHAAPPPTP